MPSSRGSCQPRDWTHTSLTPPASAGGFFTTSATWEARPWSPEQVNPNFPKWITNFPDLFTSFPGWAQLRHGNQRAGEISEWLYSGICHVWFVAVGFSLQRAYFVPGNARMVWGWLSLRGDVRECITRWWQSIASRPSPPSSRNRTEFTLREITTSFPLISQVTEPSVTWQSSPGSRPLPICSSERFIDFVGWRFSLNPWFDLTELREFCFAFF